MYIYIWRHIRQGNETMGNPQVSAVSQDKISRIMPYHSISISRWKVIARLDGSDQGWPGSGVEPWPRAGLRIIFKGSSGDGGSHGFFPLFFPCFFHAFPTWKLDEARFKERWHQRICYWPRLQDPTELWKKKNVSIYRRRLSMIEKLRTFFFSIINFSIIIFFSIILSVP